MSQIKEKLNKKGWLPEKSISRRSTSDKSSITGMGIRSSVSGLMGRNKDNADDSSLSHVARPLTDLQDPASFAPPPRRTGSGLAPAPKPVSTKRQVVMAPSKYADPRAGPVAPPPRNTGTGIQAIEAPSSYDEEEDHQQRPYRLNTTGLSTDNLPKPPARRDGANTRSPPSYDEATEAREPSSKTLPPSLPPRLPPRTAAEAKNGGLNEGAMNRLTAAGVSVPALGIGRVGATNSSSPSPPPPATRHTPSPSPGAGTQAQKWGSQVNQLQNRFAKLGTPSAGSSSEELPPREGTTLAQKQAALKTATAFQRDPSSVSFSDAKAAASTANNFRQRHGEQLAAGVKTANNTYDAIADSQSTGTRQNKSSPPPLPGPSQPYTGASSETAQATGPGFAGKKKPPPPPPKKKPALTAAVNMSPVSQAQEASGPPPIPMSTRPQF